MHVACSFSKRSLVEGVGSARLLKLHATVPLDQGVEAAVSGRGTLLQVVVHLLKTR